LAALANQALMTLSWGDGEPKILGELELAINLAWLQLQDDKLWAAAYSNSGLNRFYRYTLTDLETPAKRWQLPKGYDGLIKDENLAVFYDYNSSNVQVFDVKNNELRPMQSLEKVEEESTPLFAETSSFAPTYWNWTQPLLHKGWFYRAEQQPFQTKIANNLAFMPPIPEDGYRQPQWLLRSWDLATVKEAAARQIPGQPLAFTANGELITQERIGRVQQQVRLNLLKLQENSARLLQSKVVTCEGYPYLLWANEAVYMGCQTGDNYYYLCDDVVYDEAEVKRRSIAMEPPPCVNVGEFPEPEVQIVKLNPSKGFSEEASWTLPGYQNLRAITGETAFIASSGWRYNSLFTDVATEDVTKIPALNNGCNVYKLLPDQKAEFVSNLPECPYYGNNTWTLTANKAWIAKGFEGISVLEW